MNDTHVAVLLLLQSGMIDIPEPVFTEEIKNDLLKYDLAVLTNQGWFITTTGEEWLDVNFYNTDKNRKSYNEQINSMNTNQVNAWLCAALNCEKGFFNRLKITELRTMMQHLLNMKIHKKMGEKLIRKWHRQLSQSIEFFDSQTNTGGYDSVKYNYNSSSSKDRR